MALIKCPECGRENVSDTATSCPSCGYNILKHMEAQRQSANEKEHDNAIELQKGKFSDSDKKPKRKWVYIIIAVIILFFLAILIRNDIAQKQKQQEIISAEVSFDKLVKIVNNLYEAKLSTWNIYDNVESDINKMKEYVDEIQEIYGKYDMDICHEIDLYIKEEANVSSWHDYFLMLDTNYYLTSDSKEAAQKIIDAVPSDNGGSIKNFDQIRIGMTQEEVINILGEPTNIYKLEDQIRYCYGNNVAVWFDSNGLVYKFADDL